ncbi:MAG: glycosyltransferase family 2 protein [Acidobacteriota bacterium]
MTEPQRVSILIPAFNEGASVSALVEKVRAAGPWLEVLVVDDGSSDGTGEAARAAGARVITHPYNKGNGAAVKTAVRSARGELVLLMDADGQHDPEDMKKLIRFLRDYDLVVGARHWTAQATVSRGLGNALLARLASWLSGFHIPDLTSGFRAARLERFREFIHLLPNGFSYPTTSTLAFLKAGYNVAFVPIAGKPRAVQSRSKMHPWREGVRFVMIILRLITLFSPLRVFVPISAAFFIPGFLYLVYTIAVYTHVTNISVLLIIASAVLFLFGLLSEQIASLRNEPAAVTRAHGSGGSNRLAKPARTAVESAAEVQKGQQAE